MTGDEASYTCDHCGEQIVVPVDPSAGTVQEYVEDCPVCCHPIVIRLRFDDNGDAHIRSESEQDHN